ncbi:hypothetical protein TNCV_5074651 [Trichonephila clavipes]|nr:hypothetical protein TNCV_5074651 [Trichonephila clavipes]
MLLKSSNKFISDSRQHGSPSVEEAIAYQNVRIAHNGTPAHFSIRNHLPTSYPRSYIGCYRPIVRPSCSPNLNLLNFFFWNHPQSLVYKISVATVKNTTSQIVVASADIASTRICLNASDNPSSVGVTVAMT